MSKQLPTNEEMAKRVTKQELEPMRCAISVEGDEGWLQCSRDAEHDGLCTEHRGQVMLAQLQINLFKGVQLNKHARDRQAPTPLKFRAENFEAEVTEVDGGQESYVIIAQGHKPKTVRVSYNDGSPEFQVLGDRGWFGLSPVRADVSSWGYADLADAIALLYSVPGVEYVEDES